MEKAQAQGSNVAKMSLKDITELMEDTEEEFLMKLRNFGGIETFCSNWISTSPSVGLPDEVTVNARREAAGSNHRPPFLNFPTPVPASLLKCLWEGCKATNILLRISFIMQLIVRFLLLIGYFAVSGDDDEPILVLTTLLLAAMAPFTLSTIIIGVTNYKQVKHFSSFRSQPESEQVESVTRSGKIEKIPQADIVVGDICWVSAGSPIPADGIILPEVNDLHQHNLETSRVFAGTRALRDFKMAILAVGQNTLEARRFFDKTVVKIERVTRKTFMGQLDRFSSLAIYTALAVSILLLVFMIGRFSVNGYIIQGDPWVMAHAHRFATFFGLAIALFVLALPELIPFSIVLCQRLEIERLKKEGVGIRDLSVLSNCGTVTTLVLDIESLRNSVTKSEILEAIKHVHTGWNVKILLSQVQAGTDDSISLETEVGDPSNVRRLNSLKDKLDFIGSLVTSGQTVAVVSHDPPVLHRADVGISVLPPENQGSMAGIEVYLGRDWPRGLLELLTSQKRTYALVHFALQFRLLGLATVCFMEFLGGVLFGVSLRDVQTLMLSLLTFFVILGFLLRSSGLSRQSGEKKDKFTPEFFSRPMLKNMGGQVLYQNLVLVLLVTVGTISHRDESNAMSLFFNALVWMTLFNALNSTKWNGEAKIWKGMSARDPFIYIWVMMALCQIVIIQFGGLAFGTAPLSLTQWVICIAAGIGTLLVYQVGIRIPILRDDKNGAASGVV